MAAITELNRSAWR